MCIDMIEEHPVVACYFLATIVGAFFIWFCFRIVESLLGNPRATGSDLWLPLIVGVIERTLYYGSAVLGSYEIIAGWLALKAVAKFAETSSLNQTTVTRAKDPLETYYLYVSGTGLSLIIGIGSALIARHIQGLELVVHK
jgi:hypothetical protein